MDYPRANGVYYAPYTSWNNINRQKVIIYPAKIGPTSNMICLSNVMMIQNASWPEALITKINDYCRLGYGINALRNQKHYKTMQTAMGVDYPAAILWGLFCPNNTPCVLIMKITNLPLAQVNVNGGGLPACRTTGNRPLRFILR